jgi:signal peptidase I
LATSRGWKRELVEDAAILVIAITIVLGGQLGLQLYLGTSTPLLAVESESMEPTLYRGDLVIVRAVDTRTLMVGDIIIFKSFTGSSTPIVHRIMQIQNVSGELRFYTKGDNNAGPDTLYRLASDILAKVVGSVRYLGFITLLLLLPGGIGAIFLLLAVFVVASLVCGSFAPKVSNQEPVKSGLPSRSSRIVF